MERSPAMSILKAFLALTLLFSISTAQAEWRKLVHITNSMNKTQGSLWMELDENNDVTSFTASNDNEYTNAYFFDEYQPVADMIDVYVSETAPLFNTPIITAGEDLSRYELSQWLAKLMVYSTGADIAFQNSGGTRADIDENDVITYSTLYDVWPFDNVIKTVYLDGAIINNLKTVLIYHSDVTEFEEGVLYKVATNDYVFDKPENPFLDGTDPLYTGIVLRDLVEDELILQGDVYDKFYLLNEILTTE